MRQRQSRPLGSGTEAPCPDCGHPKAKHEGSPEDEFVASHGGVGYAFCMELDPGGETADPCGCRTVIGSSNEAGEGNSPSEQPPVKDARPALPESEIVQALEELTGWSLDGDALVATYRRKDWRDAIAFVNAIADEAERRDHHPDVCVAGYRTVTLRLTTHSEGGVTERDVRLATWIDRESRN